MKNLACFLLLIFTLSRGFAQKEYEFLRYYLPFYYDDADTIRKQLKNSDYRLYDNYTVDGSVTVSKTTGPFAFGFSPDSCSITRSRSRNVLDIRLYDSTSTFRYHVDFSYKRKATALKDFKYLCRRLDIRPVTDELVTKTVYFELDNDLPVCISHVIYMELSKKALSRTKHAYVISFNFDCRGERDIRTYQWPKRW